MQAAIEGRSTGEGPGLGQWSARRQCAALHCAACHQSTEPACRWRTLHAGLPECREQCRTNTRPFFFKDRACTPRKSGSPTCVNLTATVDPPTVDLICPRSEAAALGGLHCTVCSAALAAVEALHALPQLPARPAGPCACAVLEASMPSVCRQGQQASCPVPAQSLTPGCRSTSEGQSAFPPCRLCERDRLLR